MKRRRFLGAVVGGLAGGAIGAGAAKKRNVLLIAVDGLGPELGWYGRLGSAVTVALLGPCTAP